MYRTNSNTNRNSMRPDAPGCCPSRTPGCSSRTPMSANTGCNPKPSSDMNSDCQCKNMPNLPPIEIRERSAHHCSPEKSEECFPSQSDPIEGMPLAMCYVPWQNFESLYPDDEALQKGTMFCKLDLDFMARRCN